jgi:hypothetical protein
MAPIKLTIIAATNGDTVLVDLTIKMSANAQLIAANIP